MNTRKSFRKLLVMFLVLALTLGMFAPAMNASAVMYLIDPVDYHPGTGEMPGSRVPTRPGILVEADRGMYDMLHAVSRLNRVGHIMIMAAHPDDEGGIHFSYLVDSPRYQFHVGYAISTFGEGGNNVLGPERFLGLGVVRGYETLTGRFFDRAAQYSAKAFDDGFASGADALAIQVVDPETGERSAARWDPNVFLYNKVQIIRQTVPDVIWNHHNSLTDHGQHQACGVFTQLAIIAAANPAYIVFDTDGITPLPPHQVQRMVRTAQVAGVSADGGAPLHAHMYNPFFPEELISFDAGPRNRAPFTTTNTTYARIHDFTQQQHMAQQMNPNARSGQVNAPGVAAHNGVSTTLRAFPAFSAPGMALANWHEDTTYGNEYTAFAGIDTSVGRINQALDSALQASTQPFVDDLEAALDAIVANFPHGPNPAIWPAYADPLTTVHIPAGTATPADIQDQINAVGGYVTDAAIALAALETIAAGLDYNDQGSRSFQFFLGLIRDNFDEVTQGLYGIQQTLDVDVRNIAPGETVRVTVELVGAAEQVYHTTLNPTGDVVFPVTHMAGGLPATFEVPAGAIIVPDGAIEDIYRVGIVFGAEMQVRGYRYTYYVTIPITYDDFTGPFSYRFDDGFRASVVHNYPIGDSRDNMASMWAGMPYPASNNQQPLADFAQDLVSGATSDPNTSNLLLGYGFRGDAPFDVPRPIRGGATFEIDGEDFRVEFNPWESQIKLVPRIAIGPTVDSRNMIVNPSDEQQTIEVDIELINHTAATMNGVVVQATPNAAGAGITSAPVTVNLPSGATTTVTLNIVLPAGFTGNPTLAVSATYGGNNYTFGYQLIDFTKARRDAWRADLDSEDYATAMHLIEPKHLYFDSVVSLSVVPAAFPDDNIRIGFIPSGANDGIIPFIQSMYLDPANATANTAIIPVSFFEGIEALYPVTAGNSAESNMRSAAGGLALAAQFDTIVVGQEIFSNNVGAVAYELRQTDVHAGGAPGTRGRMLTAFMEAGGNLVLTHQQGGGNTAMSNANGAFHSLTRGAGWTNLSGNLNITGAPIFVDPYTVSHPVFNRPNAFDLALDPTQPSAASLHLEDQDLGFQLSTGGVWYDGWSTQLSEWTPQHFGTIGYVAGEDWDESRFVGVMWGRDLEVPGRRLRPGIHGTAVGENGGNYSYVSLLILNHFENLTVGAFQLMANLLSMGYGETEAGEYGWGNNPVDAQFVFNVTVEGGTADENLVYAGATVEITANTPLAGQQFINWTSTPAGVVFDDATDANTTFVMPANHVTVTANFEYIINVEGGTADVATAPEDATVTLTAGSPPTGHVFANWTASPSGVVFADATNPNTTFVMPANEVTITANFVPLRIVTINGGTSSASIVAPGATISIAADSPPEGQHFVNWTSSPPGVVFADATSATTSFVMPENNVTITANFGYLAPDTFSITVVGGTTSASYAEAGATINITAVPPEGQQFVSWTSTSPGVIFANATSATTSFVMPESNVTVTATFEDIPKREWNPAGDNPFLDTHGHWSYYYVAWAYANDVTTGVSPTSFAPTRNISRAQFVTILYRLVGSPEVTGSNPFEDVRDGRWYTDAITWAHQEGVVLGVSATSFAPTRNITREQIATILHRYVDAVDGDDVLDDFLDGGYASAWAEDAVNWAAYREIIGRGGRLNPRGNATRAEAIAIIYRVVELCYFS